MGWNILAAFATAFKQQAVQQIAASPNVSPSAAIQSMDHTSIISAAMPTVIPHMAPSWTLQQVTDAFNANYPSGSVVNASPMAIFEAGALWAAGLSAQQLSDRVAATLTRNTDNAAAQIGAQAIGSIVTAAATGGKDAAVQAAQSVAVQVGQAAATTVANAVANTPQAAPNSAASTIIGDLAAVAQAGATGGTPAAVAVAIEEGIGALVNHYASPTQGATPVPVTPTNPNA